MSNRKSGFIIVVGMLALALSAGRAATVQLTPSADTTLRDSASNTNFGDANPLYIGNAKEPFVLHNRALLKFDFSGIPTNATITGVSLRVVIFRSNTDVASFDLNRVLVDWEEYEATWNNRSASVPWLAGGGQAGTEYVEAPSVTAPVDDVIFSSPGMVADVQLWVGNSGTNFGWLMLPTEDLPGTGKQLGSRESEYTPVLTVDYSLTPPVSAPVLFAPALAGDQFRFSFAAESNRAYAVEFCDGLAEPGWHTLTNIPPQPAAGIIDLTIAVSSTQGYFRVRTP